MTSTFVNTLKQLLIPGKTQRPVSQPAYENDMRAIETWAQHVIVQLVAGSGITLSPTSGQGPVVTISSSGGGGGITDITSNSGLIDVVNPTGPVTDLSVHGFPFLQYGDAHNNTGYGILVNPRGASGSANTAFGYHALENTNSGQGNTAIGNSALASEATGTDNVAIGDGALTTSNGGNFSVAVGGASLISFHGSAFGFCTAVGYQSLQADTTGTSNVAFGDGALRSITTGNGNTAIGSAANNGTTGVHANQMYTTCLGYGTGASADGCVAIGTDSTGAGCVASVQNELVLGTAIHSVRINNNTTGVGSALLGANCPATTVTAPYTWFKMKSGDGSLVYVPVWK
jgi:hypothetical protein